MMSSGMFFYLYLTSLKQQGLSNERFIGALNLVTDARELRNSALDEVVSVNRQARKDE